MAIGRRQQIEGKFTHDVVTNWGEKPWGQRSDSSRFTKMKKHRRERLRAKQDPECSSEYRRYSGYEW